MKQNLKILMLTAILAAVAGVGVSLAYAQAVPGVTGDVGEGIKLGAGIGGIGIGAGIAIGFAGLGAGIGLGIATSGVVAAAAEKPEIISKAFIFIVFIEGIAIYGLIISIFIMTILPGSLK